MAVHFFAVWNWFLCGWSDSLLYHSSDSGGNPAYEGRIPYDYTGIKCGGFLICLIPTLLSAMNPLHDTNYYDLKNKNNCR